MTDSTTPAETTPIQTLTLTERVRGIVAAAAKPLTFAQVKSSLKAAGVPTTGKSKVTDEQIHHELSGEGVFVHPAKKEGGKLSFWHTKHVSAEEKAAAKAAEAEQKKAAKAAVEEQKRAAKAAVEEQKAKEKEEAARLKAEKAVASAHKKEETAKLKAEKAVAAAQKKEETAQKKEAAAKKKAEKTAEAEQKKMEKEEAERKAALIPWSDKPPLKAPFAALVKAAKKIMEKESVSLDEVLGKLRSRLESKPPVTADFDLADFAKRVLTVAKASPPEDRFHRDHVFISAVWHASQRDSHFPKLSLTDFKKHLIAANSEDLLRLNRADEVQTMNPQLVAESETKHLTATFHFILLEGADR